VFGLRIGRNSNNTDVGQGNEFGRGNWVEIIDGQTIGATTITRSDLRAAASALKLTAYYRPEDMDIDRRALAQGNVRFCGTNTGQDLPVGSGGDKHWGEVYCITDGALTQAADKVLNTLPFLKTLPDGCKYAVRIAMGDTSSSMVSELKAENKKLKAEVEKLNHATRLSGSLPSRLPSGKTFDDLSAKERLNHLRGLAEAADRGEL
jgi:hypothetical protein